MASMLMQTHVRGACPTAFNVVFGKHVARPPLHCTSALQLHLVIINHQAQRQRDRCHFVTYTAYTCATTKKRTYIAPPSSCLPSCAASGSKSLVRTYHTLAASCANSGEANAKLMIHPSTISNTAAGTLPARHIMCTPTQLIPRVRSAPKHSSSKPAIQHYPGRTVLPTKWRAGHPRLRRRLHLHVSHHGRHHSRDRGRY